MLKSKKSLYFLMPLVLIIWGMVVYQIIDGLAAEIPASDDFEIGSFRESETLSTPLKQLHLPDQDPFLGTTTNTKKAIQVKKNNQPPNLSIKQVWPTVEYLGYVKRDSRSGMRAVAMRIDGSSHILKAGAIQDSLKLIKATDDYIIMSYKKEQKRFKKQ